MISLYGMSSAVGLKIAVSTQDKQLEIIRNSPLHERAIEGFRERITDIETVDQFIQDAEIYSFVMRAFDLEDQIFGKAMMSKLLKSDISDGRSLVNRLSDSRFREMYKVMGFESAGKSNTQTISKSWQDAMVDRYLERQFINESKSQNSTVGIALEFRRLAPTISTPFDILKNKELGEFFRRALSLPDAIVNVDIDRQAAIIESKLDLKTLDDPSVVESLINRYVALSDAFSGASASQSAAVAMLSSSVSPNGAGQFVPMTLDLQLISAAVNLPYRR